MKSKKLFINGLSSFLIIGGFLSPSYSVFAMKESSNVIPKWIPKDQNWEGFNDTIFSNLEASQEENKINSKQNFFKAWNKKNESNFYTCSKLFKDKKFEELVLSTADSQSLEKKFHIMERMKDFYTTNCITFLENLNATTVYDDYNFLSIFLGSLSENKQHILLFPSNLINDNDNLTPGPQEISIELFLSNLSALIGSLGENTLNTTQIIKVKLLFFIYATGLYFFSQINTIKQIDLPLSKLTNFLHIPIFIDDLKVFFKESLNIDKLFNTDLNFREVWIHNFCKNAVIIDRLDQNEKMLLKKISQHLKDGYKSFLTQYELNNISLFEKKLVQLLSSEKSREDLLCQFLCDITYPLISLLRHFKDSGFVFFAGQDNGQYFCILLTDFTNKTKDLQLFEKRAVFLTEALSSNGVKNDKSFTKTIVAMWDILRFIPIACNVVKSEEQCKKDIDLYENFSFYQFLQNAGISTEYQNLTTSIKGCLGEKINDFLKTITAEELKDLDIKIYSLIKGGYIKLDGHLSRSFYDLKYIVTMLNKDASYYCFSFPSISDFNKHLDDGFKSFFKLKEDLDIIESVAESLKQITHWQSNRYQCIPSDLQEFFKDIKSNILSINENLKECLNQLKATDSLIDEVLINNIIDQQEKLDETMQDFEAKTKLMNKVSNWLNKLRNLVGILRNTNTNISKNILRTKKATKKGKVQTKTNHQLSVPISSSSDLGNIKGKLDNILKRINTLETKFFNCDLNEEELKEEVSSVKRELDGIAQGLRNAKVKKLYIQDQSLDQSLNAQNEVVKYEQNQIFFINGHVKNEAESFINQNGIYKEDMNKFIQSLGDGSINSHPFHTNTLYFQKFSKEDQNTINKCIKDFDIQYVCYKEQNGQNSSLRILYGIDKKKNNVIIFYVGAPFHKGSKASTLSSKNFTDFALQPL